MRNSVPIHVFVVFLSLCALIVATPAMGQSCVDPPNDMIGWWPFDETTGATLAEDIVQNNDGLYQGSPTPSLGMVNNAIDVQNNFGGSDFVSVPHDSSLNVGTGDFSVDFWVDPESLGTIVSKFDGSTGWEIGLDILVGGGGGGPLLMITALDSGSGIGYSPCGNINSWGWNHVVVTFDRSDDEVACFVDGSSIGTLTGYGIAGDFDNTADLEIGGGTYGFDGRVDELEIFERELSASEASSLYNANSDGKCKDDGQVPWDKPFCRNQKSITVNTKVCNYSGQTRTYGIDTVSPLPVGWHPQCNIPGPTSFTVLDSSVTVPPGQCGTIRLKIDRPAGMTSVNTIGCYEVTFRNLGNGDLFTRAGSVWDTRDRCAVITQGDFEAMPVAETREVIFEVTDTGGLGSFPAEIRAVPSDMEGENTVISLDGQEPGAPARREVFVQPGGTAEVGVTVRFTEIEPFRPFELILISDPGTAREQILQSTGLLNVESVVESSDGGVRLQTREPTIVPTP